jgi:hypothetical protein
VVSQEQEDVPVRNAGSARVKVCVKRKDDVRMICRHSFLSSLKEERGEGDQRGEGGQLRREREGAASPQACKNVKLRATRRERRVNGGCVMRNR